MKRVRVGILVRGATPSNGQDTQHPAGMSVVRRDMMGRGNDAPVLIGQAVKGGGRGEAPVRDHDVSGPGWQSEGRGITSTTSMLPRWQCGQIRKDTPVSVSCRSR
jgi:hypothetical protein